MSFTNRVSVIMPVFLGPYSGAASSRDWKFVRSLFSFVNNDYHNKELIVCSDGCDSSQEIYERHKHNLPNVLFYKIEKQPLFSGKVRQHALDMSSGNIICYLDADDYIAQKTTYKNLGRG